MNEAFMKEKPVFPLLLSMALPMVLSMLVNSLYNIVDSFFVAKISEEAMTALSLVYPVQNFISAAAIGFGVGMNAVISFHLGAGHRETADKAATQGFLLACVHGILLTAGSIAIMPAFLRMFTDSQAVMDLGMQYSAIAFSFSLIIMIDLSFEKLFQSVGRMKVTMTGLLFGAISNMILDPLFIFGISFFPELGIRGAALATGIGQVLTLLVYLAAYLGVPSAWRKGAFAAKENSWIFGLQGVHLSRKYLALDRKMVLRLYGIGIPAVLNLALPSLLISCLNGLLAAYAQSYVVVLGIYYKLQTFLYLPANGIVQGMRPIIGYNFGAGEQKRVRSIYTITLGMIAAIMAVGTVICLLGAKQVISLFTVNPRTIAAGQTALRIICAGFIVSSVSVTSSGALEGLGKGAHSLIVTMCRYVIVILPAAYILSRIMGPSGVWNAFWVSEIVTAGIALAVFRRAVKK